MKKGAIFDLDGTLLDSMSIWDRAGELFLEKLGIRAEKDLGQTMFAMSMEEGAKFLQKQYGLTQNIEVIMEGINQTVHEFYYYQVELKKGVRNLLDKMKQAEYTLVAATSSDRNNIEEALRRLDILAYFDRIYTCTEIGAGKDQPDIYLAAAGFLGLPPARVWVFEDALHALETAHRAGFLTVAIYDSWSREEQEEIQKICDIYLTELDQDQEFWKKSGTESGTESGTGRKTDENRVDYSRK